MVALDTIAAIATAPGVGAVGIIRVSGPQAFLVAKSLFRVAGRAPELKERSLSVGWIVDPSTDQGIDEALLLAFPAPKSFTTEDVIELQCHGGTAVLERVLGLVLSLGVRLADRGEFTRRAFLGGRIDLTRAEAIAEIVEAKADRALIAAVANLAGRLAKTVRELRQGALDILADLEVQIDFPEDTPAELASWELLRDSLEKAQALVASSPCHELARTGIKVALLGRPNVGKSSLFNALLGRDRAIVMDRPGTTRDVLEAELQVGGIPVQLLDTAGLHDCEDPVEAESIRRSKLQLASVQIGLLVFDAGSGWTPTEGALARLMPEGAILPVANKVDLVADFEAKPWMERLKGCLPVSAQTGFGLAALEQEISRRAKASVEGGSWDVSVNARQRAALEQAIDCLTRAVEVLDAGGSCDLVAIDVRSAIVALGKVTGDDLTEDLLDSVFSRFCLGK